MEKKKIVLIEDDEILSRVIYEELDDIGFNVSQAFDGESGLKSVKTQMPDLVLLDLLMPKKHGFDVLEELKSSPDTRGIPVIILTMLGRDEDVTKGIKLGASDYIVKSQHAVSEIVDKIKEFFASESQLEEKQKEQNFAPDTTSIPKDSAGSERTSPPIPKIVPTPAPPVEKEPEIAPEAGSNPDDVFNWSDK